ncbi:hypothetical protein Tco_1450553, partial [Tanacetum coccineum]
LKARDCKELVEKFKCVLDWKNKPFPSPCSSKGKAKVAWELVCLPKDEGGLGIRRLELFNSALLVSHIWNLLSLKESLWVKWVHAYKLNGRNFWDVPIRGNMSWSWRKILQLRSSIRDFIWRKIGQDYFMLFIAKLVVAGGIQRILFGIKERKEAFQESRMRVH